MTLIKFKKGSKTYMKCVGYGLTTYEPGEDVASVRNGKITLENRDYPYDAKTGRMICDLPDLGLRVSLCVTEAEVERAKRYIKEDIDAA